MKYFSSHEPVDVADHGREGVKEEGGELVERVEDEGVAPDDDREAYRTHTQHIVGLKPELGSFFLI